MEFCGKATKAKEEQSHAQVKEAFNLAYTEHQMELLTENKGDVKKVATTGIVKLAETTTQNTEVKSFWDFLLEKEYINNQSIVQIEKLLGNKTALGNGSGTTDVYKVEEGDDGKYTVTYYFNENNMLMIWSQDQVQKEEGGDTPTPPESDIIVNAKDISASEKKYDFYGATVTNYACTNSEGVNAWKIFYASETNIYLIADNYISYSYIPKGKDGTALTKGGSDYKVIFTPLNTSSYKGSADITDARMKALNSDYFSKNYTSTNLNMKTAAYMLDTTVWSAFAGNGADYAIGGPTIELLLLSYNQKHDSNYKARAKNNVGYELSKDGGTTWANSQSGMLDKTDSLYVSETSTSKATGMWLASPTATDSEYGLCASNGGFVGSNGLTLSVHGLRPIVCLNTNVNLKKTGNMLYEMQLSVEN